MVSAQPAGAASLRLNSNVRLPVAQVSYILRLLEYRPPRGKLARAVRRTKVFTDYFLRTKVRDKAAIRFGDGTSLLLNQQTAIIVRPHVTYLQRGEIAEYLAPGSDHRITTVSATATAIGTVFDVKITAKTTVIVVVHGAVLISNKHGKVLVKANQGTSVTPTSPPQQPQKVDAAGAISWTTHMPSPALGENIALDANGGSVVDATSSYTDPNGNDSWQPDFAIDGRLDRGWESDTGDVQDTSLTLEFSGAQPYTISKVIIDPAATQGEPSSMDLKDFEISVSASSDDYDSLSLSDFTTVLQGTCQQRDALQSFSLPSPVPARYLRLTVDSNYGNPDRVALAEIEVIGTAGQAYPGTWKVIGRQGQVSEPDGIARDSSGNFYVTDGTADQVFKLSPSGSVLATWGGTGTGPGQFMAPVGIALDAHGNIYVSDSGNNRIQKLSPGGQPLAQWGGMGTGAGQFNDPSYIALDAQGNLYVSDSFNDRIQKLSPAGRPLAQWGTTGVDPGQFDGPQGIALDSQGNLYVADQGNDRIQKLSPNGQPLAEWGGDAGTALGELQSPVGVAVDSRGIVFVTEQENNRVQAFSAGGQALAYWGTAGDSTGALLEPAGITVDTEDNAYVADSGNARIQELTPTLPGKATSYRIRQGAGLRTGSLPSGDVATGLKPRPVLTGGSARAPAG